MVKTAIVAGASPRMRSANRPRKGRASSCASPKNSSLALINGHDEGRCPLCGFALSAWRCMVDQPLQQGLHGHYATLNGGPEISARGCDLVRPEGSLQGSKQSRFAVENCALRADDGQGQEVLIVTGEPREQASAQERRFAAAGRTEHDEQSWRGRLA